MRVFSHILLFFKLLRTLLLILFLQVSFLLSAQVHVEIGELEIENFSPKTYKSHPQNWTIEQDNNGLMYFGNNLGVLIYDGLKWELVKTANESTVRSLDVSPRGKVYVGASGDFGYLKADRHGKLSYVSISRLFKLKEEDIGDVIEVSAFDQGVYFLTANLIYFYNGMTLRLWEGDDKFQYAIKKEGSYIVKEKGKGFAKMLDDTLIPVRGPSEIDEERIYDVGEYKKELLILTERQGFTSFIRGMYDEYLEKLNANTDFYNPYNFSYIKNEFLVIGTWGNGLIFTDREGDVVQHMSTKDGLIDAVVTDQYLDKEGNLWITTSNGISRIVINENISAFKAAVNVDETVEKIVRFNDKMFIATHTGLYCWEEENKAGTFQRVAGINTECWDLLPFNYKGNSMLLIAGNNAVYQLDEKMNLEQLVSCLPWTFHKLKDDESTVFVGLDNGLMCMNYIEGSWKIQNNIGDVSNTIYCIAQSEEKRVWLGTLNNGVIRLDLQERITHFPYQFHSKKFGVTEGLPAGGVYVTEYVGGMLFGTGNGIFEYREDKSLFLEEMMYKEASGIKDMVVHRISEDETGKLWLVAYWEEEFYTGFFERNNSNLIWHDETLKPVSNEVFHTIHHDAKEVTWIGGPDGLFRINLKKEDPSPKLNFNVLIRKVYLNKDSLDFAGNIEYPNYKETTSASSQELIYPYEFNSMSITFSSQFHKYAEKNRYSYMLEGFDDHWSEWNTEMKAVYTNLHEGDYFFKVKSKNVYGKESEISTYGFSIESPWYRTWWAYLIYSILSVFLIYSVVLVYTKKLKQIIRDRTAEVVFQKEEIEKQKDEVEHQRRLLEVKNNDITSSINYAKRLQEALLPNREVIDKYLKEYFIVYKPKDIVSGDFYWMEHVNGTPGEDVTLFATVDCTGHGVPGAFVSVVGNSGLNRAVNEFGLRQPAAILDKLNEIVVDTLNKGDQELRDGMDISLCSFDFNKMELQFAGANNSVYVFRKDIITMPHNLNGSSKFYKDDLLEIKANKQPVGFYEFRQNFKNNSIKLQKGDVIYLFSDGYTDQFGGPDSKKYNAVRFKNFLLTIYDKPMSVQKILIEEEFEKWKGDEEQIDDVIVTGIRV